MKMRKERNVREIVTNERNQPMRKLNGTNDNGKESKLKLFQISS